MDRRPLGQPPFAPLISLSLSVSLSWAASEGKEGRHARRLRDEGGMGWHAVMQVAGQPSETLANQPPGSQANKQPAGRLARQSASQPAIRTPFKHLLLPAMRISLYPSSLSRPSPPSSLSHSPVLSPSFSLSLSHSHSLSLCVQLSDICRGWHGRRIISQRIPGEGGVSRRATIQPSGAASLAASNEAASNTRATSNRPVGRPATRPSFHRVSPPGADQQGGQAAS